MELHSQYSPQYPVMTLQLLDSEGEVAIAEQLTHLAGSLGYPCRPAGMCRQQPSGSYVGEKGHWIVVSSGF